MKRKMMALGMALALALGCAALAGCSGQSGSEDSDGAESSAGESPEGESYETTPVEVGQTIEGENFTMTIDYAGWLPEEWLVENPWDEDYCIVNPGDVEEIDSNWEGEDESGNTLYGSSSVSKRDAESTFVIHGTIQNTGSTDIDCDDEIQMHVTYNPMDEENWMYPWGEFYNLDRDDSSYLAPDESCSFISLWTVDDDAAPSVESAHVEFAVAKDGQAPDSDDEANFDGYRPVYSFNVDLTD